MKNLRTVVLPAVALVIFCISLKNSFLVASNSERTTAVCTSIEKPTKRTRRSRSRGFNPLRSSEYKFRFTSKDGQEHTSSIKYGAFWLNPEVGDTVNLVYAKDSPDSIYYDSVFYIWMIPAISGGVMVLWVGKRLIGKRNN